MVLGRSCMIARLLVIVLAAGNAAGFMPAFVHKHAAASHQHLGGVAGSCRSTPARPTSIRREVTRCAIIDGREELSKKVRGGIPLHLIFGIFLSVLLAWSRTRRI